jgi:hypothetical protein
MGLVSLTLPTVGQPNSTEDPKINSALTALQNVINGNIDTANIANNGVATGELADLAVTAAKLGVGSATRLLGFLNSDGPGTWGSGVARFLNTGTGVTVTHTHTTVVAVVIWGWWNSGGTTTTMTPVVLLDAVSQGTMSFITTLGAGEKVLHAAAQNVTVTAGVHSWNARATQGANATTVSSAGPALLMILEQH